MKAVSRWVCTLFCVAALYGTALHAAAPALAGSPPVVRLPATLEVYPQNFDVVQDAQSVLYVANSDGVMIYDGSRWSLLRLPNADLARTLAFDGVDRVYVGGFDAFGYIQRDALGVEVYHDLSAAFAKLLQGEKFEDIWDIHLSPRGVFFRALNHVFLYQPDSGAVRLWRHAGRFGAVTEYRGQTLIQFRGQGLKLLQGDQWQLLPGSEPLSELVYQLIAMPGDALLTVSSDGRWRRFENGKVSEQKMPAGMPASSQFSQVRRLADGSLALAGVEGRLYLLDRTGSALRSFSVAGGMLSGLAPANDGGLLTAGEDAVYHIAWPSPWSVIGKAEGLTGSLFGMRPWHGRWYAATGHGVYEATSDGRFHRLAWTEHEAWDLLAVDDDTAFLAESYSLKQIRGGKAQVIGADLYPRLLQASDVDPAVIYVGTESGLALLHRQGGGWQLRLNPAGKPAMRVNSIVEIAPRELWVGTERNGIQWLRLADDYGKVIESRAYGSGSGISFGPLGGGEVVRARDGGLLVTTSAGIFRWKDGRFVADPMEGLVDLRRQDEWLTLVQAPGGGEWAYSDMHIFHRERDGHWQREELGGILQGAVQTVVFEENGSALFTTTSSVLRYDTGIEPAQGRPPPLLLRAVEQLGAKGQRQSLPLLPETMPRYTENERLGFAFRFSLPEFRQRDATRYQARLVGASEGFSEWTEATSFTYTRLGPGEYRFEARARDALGQVSELQPYNFIIEPRWYGSLWGRALLAVAFLALVAALNVALTNRRTRRLSVEKTRLEAMVAQRTRELESANRQLQAIAHLDGLTEIPNRRRLDDYLSEVWQQCVAQQRPMSVLIIDGDHFKQFNDEQGHLAGDGLLRRIAEVLSSCLRRAEDLVARYGGDEFVVVLPGAAMEMALEIAETMRARVAAADFGLTVSIGVASHQPLPDEPVSTLVHEADEALYEAKRRGRNRVSAYDSTWT